MSIQEEQRKICEKYLTDFSPPDDELKVGMAKNVKGSLMAINGLRHLPQGDTWGWYIWAGKEMSTTADFFMPLHVQHIAEYAPHIQKFLALPPGWRFYKEGDFEDVWYYEGLLGNEKK